MRISFDTFSECPEFIDIRHDSYSDVMSLIERIKEASQGNPDDFFNFIRESDPNGVVQRYSSKCRDISNGNQALRRSLSRVNFNRYKQVIGDDDFV